MTPTDRTKSRTSAPGRKTAASTPSAARAAKTAKAKPAVAKKPVAKSAAKTAAKPAAKQSAAPPRSRKPAASKAPVAPRKALPPKKPKKAALPADPVERLRLEVKKALEDLKARDIVEIDVRGKTSIADYLVVASGTSNRHVKSIADEVIKNAKRGGAMPLGVEGQREAEWVLVDLGDLVVHVMLPRVREFYGLERLWSVGEDAPAALRA